MSGRLSPHLGASGGAPPTCARRAEDALAETLARVCRDVVLQDVVLRNTSLEPLTHISFRCEVPTPSVFEGRSTKVVQTPHLQTPYP